MTRKQSRVGTPTIKYAADRNTFGADRKFSAEIKADLSRGKNEYGRSLAKGKCESLPSSKRSKNGKKNERSLQVENTRRITSGNKRCSRHDTPNEPAPGNTKTKKARSSDIAVDPKTWMADYFRDFLNRDEDPGGWTIGSKKCRELKDEWYIIKPGVAKRDAVEGVDIFTGDQAIIDECYQSGIYQEYVVGTEDGREILEKAGLVNDPFSIVSKSVMDLCRKAAGEGKDGENSPVQHHELSVTAEISSTNAVLVTMSMEAIEKLLDLQETIDARQIKAKTDVAENTGDVVFGYQAEYYDALDSLTVTSLMALSGGTCGPPAIESAVIQKSMGMMDRVVAQYRKSGMGPSKKSFYGSICEQLVAKIKAMAN